ncbi:TcpQ domain-containing protein [Chitinimonas koreensis]|uniref:TcpQ domain-containing protein n=1 Tax=Chitinimonas koreensis TaxID=356302 RepID=UPI000424AD0D|nr:TcpQ domain-containing protein [Chitinimonas koreensis]QNM95522.1 TcpQ domain-containing protein [Chitinimonas koreensis]
MTPIHRAIAGGALVLCTLAAHALEQVGQFDFRYRIGGDRLVSQVFDDGNQTFLQLRGDAVPTVVDQTAGSAMVEPSRRGQYWVLPRLAQRFTVVVGTGRADVAYTGERARGATRVTGTVTAPPAAASQQAVPRDAGSPSRTASSPDDTIEVATGYRRSPAAPAPAVSPDAAIQALAAAGVIDEERASALKADALRRELARLDQERLAREAQRQSRPAAAASNCTWKVAQDDRYLSAVLERWAGQGGYQRVFVELADDPLIEATGEFCGSLTEATEQLLAALGPRSTIQAVFHTGNKTIQLVAGNE